MVMYGGVRGVRHESGVVRIIRSGKAGRCQAL